jgi:hypothetical protein
MEALLFVPAAARTEVTSRVSLALPFYPGHQSDEFLEIMLMFPWNPFRLVERPVPLTRATTVFKKYWPRLHYRTGVT